MKDTLMEAIKHIILKNQDMHPHIVGFNYFIDNDVERIIRQKCEIDIKTAGGLRVKTKIGNVYYTMPDITVSEAFKNMLTYYVTFYVDIDLFVNGKLTSSQKDHKFVDIPVVVRSNACNLSNGIGNDEFSSLNYGGYFIIAGKPKFISANRVKKRNIPIIRGLCVSGMHKCIASVQVMSGHRDKPSRSTSTLKFVLGKRSKGRYEIDVIMPYAKNKTIPLAVLLSLLRISVDDFLTILESISDKYEYMISYIMRLKNSEVKYDEAKDIILQNYTKFTNPDSALRDKLDIFLLPHIGEGVEFKYEKIRYIAHCVDLLIRYDLKLIGETDMQDISLDTLEETGSMMSSLFRMKLTESNSKQQSKVRQQIVDNIISIDKLFDSKSISNLIARAISNGSWTKENNGVSQAMDVTSHLESICNLRKVIVSKTGKSGKHAQDRTVHSSYNGFICAVRTIEGKNCGLVRELACTCIISPRCDIERENEFVMHFMRPLLSSSGKVKLFDAFGAWVGNVKNVEDTVEVFKRARRCNGFSIYNTILEIRPGELFIFVQGGRFMKPSMVSIEKFKPNMDIYDMIFENVIEYVEPGESFNQIFPAQIIGLNAGQNPFINHNMGPRNTYQTGMAFQATSSTLFEMNGQSTMHTLTYAQRPLCNTSMAISSQLDINRLEGLSMTVAIAPYFSNEEDGLTFNRATLERFAYNRDSRRTYTSEQKNNDMFHKPDPKITQSYQIGSYEKLEDNGLPKKRQRIDKGDIIIGKTQPSISKNGNVVIPLSMSSKEERRRDVSIRHKGAPGSVTDVYESKSAPFIRYVSTSSYITPELGDKYTSRHGQKGTLCSILPAVDMPFDQYGISPDIIIAPEAFPSRMTMGKQLEMLFGKAAAMDGDLSKFVDPQNFEKCNTSYAESVLHKYGFKRDGTQMLTDGITGEMIRCPIFVGIIHYSQLTHFSGSKLYARETGKKTPVTRQPSSGRQNNGGLRFGIMEADNSAALGASKFISDRMYESSDKASFFYCKKCSQKAEVNKIINFKFCKLCGTGDHVVQVDKCFTTGVMMEEMYASGIEMKPTLT